MVKVKVVRKFKDKEDKKIYQKGAIRTITEERLSEIQKAGEFVEVIPEEAGTEENESRKETEPDKATEEKKAAKTSRKK